MAESVTVWVILNLPNGIKLDDISADQQCHGMSYLRFGQRREGHDLILSWPTGMVWIIRDLAILLYSDLQVLKREPSIDLGSKQKGP